MKIVSKQVWRNKMTKSKLLTFLKKWEESCREIQEELCGDLCEDCPLQMAECEIAKKEIRRLIDLLEM